MAKRGDDSGQTEHHKVGIRLQSPTEQKGMDYTAGIGMPPETRKTKAG